MKLQWSVFFSALSLLTLVGCGSEQFGSTPQSATESPSGLEAYSAASCSSYTLVKPKVDILYVVDNSGSSFYLSNDIKSAITNTVNTVSSEFDYRIIGAPLIPTASSPYEDYQVLTNSSEKLPIPGKKIISSSELSFFQTQGAQYQSEKGLQRTIEFINNTGTLFRRDAYLLVVMVSNGRDTEVETDPNGDGNTVQNTSLFEGRVASFNSIKTRLNLTQLRFFSVTAKTACKPDWRRSTYSYVAMASALQDSASYDLCTGSVANIFSEVNNTIKQQVVPHQYRFWPITFAENNESVSLNELQVKKYSANGASTTLVRNTDWTYVDKGSPLPVNTRELPSPGEPVTGRHFIRFTNLLSYPNCVQVSSVSRTEYFGWISIPREPRVDSTMYVTINGRTVPQDATNGWSYRGNMTVPNVKMPYPKSGDELPAISKSGFMIQLNGSDNYYKSGDNVQVNYLPASL
jgi:hypothetical protein